MATITAITSSTDIALNVLDPATWVGGVVPGPADTAVFPVRPSTTISTPTAGGFLPITPWDTYRNIGTAASIVLPRSGSMYTFPQYLSDPLTPVKIDFSASSGTTLLISCSIDHSYRQWLYQDSHSYTETYPGDNPVALGFLNEQQRVFFGKESGSGGHWNWQNRYELTGSGTWEVGAVTLNIGCDFTVKDSATLILNSTTLTTLSRITPAQWGGVRILDQATLHLTGSYDIRNVNSVFNGITGASVSNAYIIISGSANYSSSLLASSSAAGDSTITLQNPENFAIGDYITIQSIPNFTRVLSAKTGSSSNNISGSLSRYNSVVNHSFPTGSIAIPYFYSVFDTASYETDDVVQIESIYGNTATISKRYGKQGEIQQDLGLYTYQQFVETYKKSINFFTGQRRVVLVDSNHHDFQAGETIIISGSAYPIMYATSYLSQSKFIDFRDSETQWTNHIALNEFMYTGSNYTISDTTAGRATYRKYDVLTSSSRAGTSSLYLNSASTSAPNSIPIVEGNMVLPIRNTFFQEGEITISGSIIRDFTGAASASNHLGISTGHVPYTRHGYVSTNWDTILDAHYDQGTMFIVGPQYAYIKNGAQSSTQYIDHTQQVKSGNSNLDVYNVDGDFVIPQFTGSGQQVELKVTRQDGIQRSYLQGVLVDEFLNSAEEQAMIGVILSNYASLFSINIKERYQMLILDTQNSFSYRDTIKQSGLLDMQTAGKICKFLGNEIEDPMGYRNLAWQYYYDKGQTNILPYCHNFIQTTANVTNTGVLNLIGGSRPMMYTEGPTRGFHQNAKAGVDCFITYDLNEPISFDTIGVGFHRDTNYTESDTNNTMVGIRIDVGDDPNTFTTVYARANDTRVATNGNAYRTYTFPSGSVTKRFIRLYSEGGTSATSPTLYNYINFFGVYNYATASYGAYPTDTTRQIKLKSAKSFGVGDQIRFWNKQGGPGSRIDGAYIVGTGIQGNIRFINYDAITNIATSAQDSDTVGGLTDYYTITAISGSVITLDRDPTYYHLFKGTVVQKLNRGKINITGGRRNRFTIQSSGQSTTLSLTNFQHYVCSNGSNIYGISSGVGSTTQWQLRSEMEDVFAYSPQQNRYTHGTVALRERNIIGRAISVQGGYGSHTYNSYTHITFNVFNCNSIANSWLPVSSVDRFIYNHNVHPYDATQKQLIGAVATANMFRQGLIIFKNNYYPQLSSIDPRIITFFLGSSNTYHRQLAKQFKWDSQSNFFSGAMLATSTTNAATGIHNTIQNFKIRDYGTYSMQPVLPRKYNIAFAQHNIPYFQNGTQTIAPFDGYLETLELSPTLREHVRIFRPTILSSTLIFKQDDYYATYMAISASTQDQIGNFLKCVFYVTKTADIRIQLDMLARVFIARKHSMPAAQTTAAVNQGYDYYGKVLPKIVVIDLDRNIVLYSKLISSLEWQDASINEIFNLRPGHYVVTFEQGFNAETTAQSSKSQRLLDFTRPRFNLVTNNKQNIDIISNNWDIVKLLDNVDHNIDDDMLYTSNMGVETVVKVSNDLNSSIRFNKVKL
jgi:hypothetical protein